MTEPVERQGEALDSLRPEDIGPGTGLSINEWRRQWGESRTVAELARAVENRLRPAIAANDVEGMKPYVALEQLLTRLEAAEAQLAQVEQLRQVEKSARSVLSYPWRHIPDHALLRLRDALAALADQGASRSKPLPGAQVEGGSIEPVGGWVDLGASE